MKYYYVLFRSELEAYWENGIYKVSINTDYSKLGDLCVLSRKHTFYVKCSKDEYCIFFSGITAVSRGKELKKTY